MGKLSDMLTVVQEGQADAVAMADILHYDRATISQLRKAALLAGLKVRSYDPT